MKRITTIRVTACSILLASQTVVIAADMHPLSETNAPELILTVDVSKFSTETPRTDTYNSLFGQQSNDVSAETVSHSTTTKLNNVGKKLKRLTSLRYGKQQKIRAKVGKSSLSFKYTRIL